MKTRQPKADNTVRSAGAPQPSAPVVRRRQEDRTRDAKSKLLNAAIQVLLRDGYGGLTTKEVAKTAGLSYGALMHHYATKEELVVAATSMVYDECIVRGQRVAQTDDAVRNPLEGYIADCISVYFEWPFIAALEVVMVARTDPGLMAQILPVMAHYRATCDDIWLEVFEKSGVPKLTATGFMNMSLNLVRGMAVNRFWNHDEAQYKTAINKWTALANAQIQAELHNKPVKKTPSRTRKKQ
ncbi:MAG: TetR/AcrR family transcriptional regulator [Pseudomonadota bacterium]